MGDIVTLETNLPHIVAELICVSCKKRWIDVFPVSVWLKDLECPFCREVGFVITTGQEIDDTERG